jgi:hypothetical protein
MTLISFTKLLINTLRSVRSLLSIFGAQRLNDVIFAKLEVYIYREEHKTPGCYGLPGEPGRLAGARFCWSPSKFWVRLHLVVSYTSPLTPLQPILLSIAGDFLAGEGRLLERGLCPLSELTPPLKQIMNRYKR